MKSHGRYRRSLSFRRSLPGGKTKTLLKDIIKKGKWKINHLFKRLLCIEKIFSAMYKNGKTGNPMISTKEKD